MQIVVSPAQIEELYAKIVASKGLDFAKFTRKAGIYLRISFDRKKRAAGVRRQLEDCLIRCHELGCVPVIYCDNDRSATKRGVIREDYQRMKTAMASRNIEVVICYDTDRLFRQLIEAEEFINLSDEKNIAMFTVAGEFDLSDPEDRRDLRQAAIGSSHYVETMKKKQKRAMQQMADDGVPHWPSRPFGFTMPRWIESDGVIEFDDEDATTICEIDLVPDEAAAIEKAYADLMVGVSLKAIAREWNDAGLATPKGLPWNGLKVRNLLLCERNAGLRKYAPRGKDGKATATTTSGPTTRGQWPAIVTEVTWRGAVAFLRNPDRLASCGPFPARKYLLSGLAICGECGTPMGSRLPSNLKVKAARYCCRKGGCMAVSRAVEPVDNWVIGHVVTLLRDTRAPRELLYRDDVANLAELLDRQGQLEEEKRGYGAMMARGELEPTQLPGANAVVNAKLAALDVQIRDARKLDLYKGLALGTGEVGAQFMALSLDRQRGIINDLVMVTVKVGQARRGPFDEGLVDVVPSIEFTPDGRVAI